MAWCPVDSFGGNFDGLGGVWPGCPTTWSMDATAALRMPSADWSAEGGLGRWWSQQGCRDYTMPVAFFFDVVSSSHHNCG